jgi:hypothetical protein
MSESGGEVPRVGVFRYDPPKGPKNMDTKGDVYRQGSQGPTPCENYESGTAGALNTRVLPDGLDQDDKGGFESG